MISSSASKTVSKPSRMRIRFLSDELVLESPRHHLETEVEEVPEDLLEVEPLGASELGVFGRDQTG